MDRENNDWEYDRIAGAPEHLGHCISDQTAGNILRRFGIAPAPKRSQHINWKNFIPQHTAVMAGIDFLTVEVLTWRGLTTYYVLFFLQLETALRQISGHNRASDRRLDDPEGSSRYRWDRRFFENHALRSA